MIAFDFDDVIADLQPVIRKEIIKQTGHDIGEHRKTYFVNIPGQSSDETKSMISEIIKYNTRLMDEIPNSINILGKIYKLIHRDILIITARRPKETKDETMDWLHEHIKNQFPYKVKFTNGQSKNDYFDSDIKYFVDDLPYYVNEAAKVLDHVFLLDKSWNQNIKLRRNISRIKTLESVYVFLEKSLKMS